MLVPKKALFLSLITVAQVLSCEDSSTFTFGSYPYNADRTTRTCAWLEENENNTEARKALFCTSEYDGKIVQDECPVACNTCAPSSSPSTSISPSIVPTQSPSEYPSSIPTLSPTVPCLDSPLRLRISTAGTKPKTEISRYCVWVARRDSKSRCALPGVSAACPATCGTCNSCDDPVDLRFRFKINGRKVLRSCDFVKRIKFKIPGRCKRSNNICRSTCGYCN